jgi:hypothetical protein
MCSPLELDRYIRRFVAARSIAGCFRFFTLTPVRFHAKDQPIPRGWIIASTSISLASVVGGCAVVRQALMQIFVSLFAGL